MKRFTDTEIWDEDWFLDLDCDHQRFWFFIKDKCNHAGVWKPNIKRFNRLLNCNIDLEDSFNILNQDRPEDHKRIIKLKNGNWFLPGFFVFQNGCNLNLNNNAHKSIYNIYNELDIELNNSSVYGLGEVKEGSKRGLIEPQGKGNSNSKGNSKNINKVTPLKKKFTPPTKKEVVLFFKEKKYPVSIAEKAFDYYQEGGWKDARGNQVKNWKQKMISVWMKEENKQTDNYTSEGYTKEQLEELYK